MEQRVIKFRAWDSEIEEMWYSDNNNGQEYCDFIIPHDGNPYFKYGVYRPYQAGGEVIDAIADETFEPDAKDIMQFTGLFDVNKKEVFEGDVLRYQHSPESKEYICEVSYNPEFASFWLKSSTDSGFAFLGHQQVIEIIGNVFSNPELLNH